MTDRRVLASIGVGANLGEPLDTVRHAILRCANLPGLTEVRCSSLYRTAPIDAQGPAFINAVVQGLWNGSPLALLHALQAIEQEHGRERPYLNAPRTLDLDLLLVGSTVMATQELQLPHPRMHRRAFVLVPLWELQPDLHLPGDKQSLERRIAAVSDQAIERVAESPLRQANQRP